MDIKPYLSFKTSAEVASIHPIESVADIEALNLTPDAPFIVLGEGSNVIFTDDYDGKVLLNQFQDLNINELDDGAFITAGAGTNWHLFVCQMSESGYYGLENLAYIPGTVGAAPVQNIGAYGVEVKSFIHEVVCYDLTEQSIVNFSRRDCGFAYRNSNFKNPEWQRRYIIIAVTFHLAKTFAPVLSYKEIKERLGADTTPEELLNEVIKIRQAKLPNHHEIPNTGSFFKNPIISLDKFSALQAKHPNIPHYPVDKYTVKLPAAWLIEKLGLKGYSVDGAAVDKNHALILINQGGATGKSLLRLSGEIIDKVYNEFQIKLEPEVRLIPCKTPTLRK